MNEKTSWVWLLFIGLFLAADSLVTTDIGEDMAQVEATPMQLTVNKLMKVWTLLDTIHALQRIPTEHLMLFARELVEGTIYVNSMIDMLVQHPDFRNDADSLTYIYDLIEHISTVQEEVFKQIKLDEIACLRVILQRMQKKLLLMLTHQQ